MQSDYGKNNLPFWQNESQLVHVFFIHLNMSANILYLGIVLFIVLVSKLKLNSQNNDFALSETRVDKIFVFCSHKSTSKLFKKKKTEMTES